MTLLGQSALACKASAMWEDTTCALGCDPDDRTILPIPNPDADCAIVQCQACGLRRLTPRPSAAVLEDIYGEDYYAYGGRSRPAWKQRTWNLLRDISGGARLRPLAPLARLITRRVFDINLNLTGGRALDVGCGYGDLLYYLKTRGYTVQGVDRDHHAAEVGARLGVPIHLGALADIDGPFDVAISQHSLEHVPDPAATIAEIARLLRPGGELHVAVPNGAAIGLEQEGLSWWALAHPEHFWYFDEHSLARLLREHGLEPERVSYRTIWRFHARRFARHALGHRDGGDLLRVVARRA